MRHDVILDNSADENVDEALVSLWYKAVGDRVEADEPIVEVMTDKATVEIVSPADGVLVEIRIDEEQRASAGSVLGVVESPDT